MAKVLFILKRREDFNATVHNYVGLSTGLFNSANFMNEMLQTANVESKLVVMPDNNSIDREVTLFRPTHVIVEALWVVPTKFLILSKLHPSVTWIIRLHSEMPFIASEGIAMDWIADYVRFPNIIIGVNAPRMLKETRFYLQHMYNWTDAETNKRVIYMPNFYPQEYDNRKNLVESDYINVSCFGAIRPLKNHLVQALSAIKFANSLDKKLRFHINSGRIEMKGEPVLNNLKGLFQQMADKGHELINHQWRPRDEFLKLCREMDIGMQVSFSETFNIVGADHISQGVPVVSSTEIPWSVEWFSANPTSSEDIYRKLHRTWKFSKMNVALNQLMLTSYTDETRKTWVEHFKN
jgi:hypothetical protein